ncbi:MAG: hypothetical protein P4L79_10650 [Legionella sp.]|uniref:hypothetical protein n=1 Tax=Legionella sp. TaxID=459 RepID=UPI00284CB8F6|nr:hypothetical protein [Legionella sp.]
MSDHEVGMRTRDSEPLNMLNKKPYRTQAQKVEARETAKKGADGAYHTKTAVSYHSRPKDM